ncbi:MAG: aminodeoxychorismate lyase [Lachnospiraceae bacterium]|jgi:UPF0755 protein|nr:aminodeoxychorismate lyase [Lachnospiraceae bacterium]
MSKATKEINRIAGAVINVAIHLIVLAILVLVVYALVTRGYAFGHKVFYAQPLAGAGQSVMQKTVAIEDGESPLDVGKKLENLGLIDDPYVFYVQSVFYSYKIYPGEYSLSTAMTSKEILEEIQTGKPAGGSS